MKDALDTFGRPWKLNPGDGAFYGPKIDIKVFDALGRAHQCATIQLDFQLPLRFNLRFRAPGVAGAEEAEEEGDEEAPDASAAPPPAKGGKGGKGKAAAGKPAAGGEEAAPTAATSKNAVEAAIARAKAGAVDDLPEGYERPVMVHRAILGSVERMMAVMIEHTGGKWPFWLSPRQISIVPVAGAYNEYAHSVGAALHAAGYYVDVDASTSTMKKKIREAQLAQYNFILVVGEKEVADSSVNIRTRDNEVLGARSLADALAFFAQLVAEHK